MSCWQAMGLQDLRWPLQTMKWQNSGKTILATLNCLKAVEQLQFLLEYQNGSVMFALTIPLFHHLGRIFSFLWLPVDPARTQDSLPFPNHLCSLLS